MQSISVVRNEKKALDTSYLVSHYATIATLLILFIVFSIFVDKFFELNNIMNIARQVSTLAIVAFGLTITMAAGDFDLSVGSIASLSGVVVAGLLANGSGMLAAILAALAVGAGIGLLNGVVSTKVGIPSMIVTLGVSSIAIGVNFMYTGGRAVYGGLPISFTALGRGALFGIPSPIFIMLILGIVVFIFLNYTKPGRYIYATGGNATAARLSGIKTLKYRTIGLMFSGLGAGIAGIVLAARLGSGQPTAGSSFLLDGLAAVFIGMTTIRIGQPNIIGTFVGVLLIGLLNNGLNLLGLPFYIQDIAKGLIMVIAVAFAASKNELKFFSS
ncbi:ABC transporter permease [Bacillus sp. S3]|uniref:ABC transporter permease n=1 Tax=Bacillus sp. S3 TaxID=486398 RepID=UPI00118AE906|nr:ABC transporter permease [Bacillus sp. S3]QCJ44624.1 ABC transporter permease [Bacillus sp. S3]